VRRVEEHVRVCFHCTNTNKFIAEPEVEMSMACMRCGHWSALRLPHDAAGRRRPGCAELLLRRDLSRITAHKLGSVTVLGLTPDFSLLAAAYCFALLLLGLFTTLLSAFGQSR
jgi:hypothetical protein